MGTGKPLKGLARGPPALGGNRGLKSTPTFWGSLARLQALASGPAACWGTVPGWAGGHRFLRSFSALPKPAGGFFPVFFFHSFFSHALFFPLPLFSFFEFSPWVPRSPSHRWVLRPCAHCLPGLPRASQMGACAPVPSPDFCAWRSGDTQVAWSGGQQGSHWCPLWVVCLHVLEKGGLRVWLPGRADVGGDREPPLWDTVGSWHSLHSRELLK